MLASIRYRACLARNGYVSKSGTREIVVDIYQFGGQRATVRTAIRVRAEDFAQGKVQASNPDYDLHNRSIHRLIRRLYATKGKIGLSASPNTLCHTQGMDIISHRTIQTQKLHQGLLSFPSQVSRRLPS